MRSFALALGLVLVAAAPVPGAAVAQRVAAEDTAVIPLGRVLHAIAERFPGHALDAALVERDGRPVYRIKWLGRDGKVRDILADARTGEILRVR